MGRLCTLSWVSPLRPGPTPSPAGVGGVSSLSETSPPAPRDGALSLRPGSCSGPWECSGRSDLGDTGTEGHRAGVLPGG